MRDQRLEKLAYVLVNYSTNVKKGDKVLFHRFDELPTHDADLVVVRENSILGVYENE